MSSRKCICNLEFYQQKAIYSRALITGDQYSLLLLNENNVLQAKGFE